MSSIERKSTRKPAMPSAALPKSQVMVRIKFKDGLSKHSPADHFQFRQSAYKTNEKEECEGLSVVPDSASVPEENLQTGMTGFAIWGKDNKYYPATIEKVCNVKGGQNKRKKKDVTDPTTIESNEGKFF